MSNILLVSDNPVGMYDRGAEQQDTIIKNELNCDFLTCAEFNAQRPEYDKYIVSNFFFLSPESKQFLQTRKFVHVANDFMFCGSRNPGIYENFKVPKDHLINLEFFTAAQNVFLQSNLQKRIFELNDIPGDLVSWGGNLWTDEVLDKMVKLGRKKKNGKAFVIDGVHKGVNGSVEMCRNLFLPFDIIGRMPYPEFLETASKYSAYGFQNVVIETFCRILLECKIMNVLPIVSQWSGAVHEEIYKYNGKDLAEKLKDKRGEIIEMLK